LNPGDIVKKILAVLGAVLCLVGCNLPRPGNATLTPTETVTDASGNQPCAFIWATHALPELSSQVQKAMDTAGMKGVSVRVEAYGEDCIDAQTQKSVGFGALETDFKIDIQVRSLSDTDQLGNLVEKVLIVLGGLPAESMASPNPGYIGIHFQAGNEEKNLWFQLQDGKAALEEGLHGRALFDRLDKK
jgi:hypothetical protein